MKFWFSIFSVWLWRCLAVQIVVNLTFPRRNSPKRQLVRKQRNKVTLRVLIFLSAEVVRISATIRYSLVSDELFYVGVHVRRGIDILMNERNLRHGHVAATADYYRRAMQMAKGDRENVVFVICSDNPSWVANHLPAQEKGTLFSCPGKHREVDMAIMTLCDALVLSTGTFSWWSGFLNLKAKEVRFYPIFCWRNSCYVANFTVFEQD
ncbi:unnamed protein product [Angiostrongylus costaricensis]|uniref:L-Fucosyltransferase n=1 Tax=Angiostrongylus costaricensis TaxID=334426 RepID=A0A3P7J4Q2_ANGCS|nr:unnamed protein product [Angiostrongylus costaricensis]